VEEAHIIATKVECAVRNALENVFDIMVHIEPAGIVSHDEVFGLSEADVLAD
jgi:divalent metal cation (Fe/Co/Zn/Cd) transporter